MIKRMKAILMLAALASCSPTPVSDLAEVVSCEEYLLAKMDTPSTYKRINSFSYRDGGKQRVSLEYDAQNLHGALVRQRQFCEFPIKDRRPDTSGFIDHDGVAEEAAAIAAANAADAFSN